MHIQSKTIAIASIATLLASNHAFAESRTFDLAPFSQIDASAGIDVRVKQGPTQSVRVEARSSKDYDHLELSVRNGKLEAATEYGFLDFIFDGGLIGTVFNRDLSLIVHVTIPQLESVAASSGANIQVTDVSGDNLRARASSGGDVNLNEISFQSVSLSASSGADLTAQGTCIEVSGNVSSGADINAKDMECKNAQANASSGGDLTLFASQSVDANASSGGDISIVGDPQRIDINTSSGGDIHIRE